MKREKFTIPAEFDHLALVRDFIERTGRKYHFSNKVINSLKLAVEEACTNIIRHGYKDMPPGKIVVRFIVRRYSFTVTLRDQGISFDPRQVKPPNLAHYVEIGKVGGLGIMMIRKLMDHIEYKSDVQGNVFTMTKYRDNKRGIEIYYWWEKIKSYGQNLHTRFAFYLHVLLSFILLLLAVWLCSTIT